MRLHALAVSVMVITLANAAFAAPSVMHVTLGVASETPVSGRLLIFAQPLAEAQAGPKGQAMKFVDVDLGSSHPGFVAAQEITHLTPGETIDVDTDALAFPKPFSKLPSGRYAVQAVLDVKHTYNLGGRSGSGGDLVSPVVEMDLPAGGALTLSSVMRAIDPTAIGPYDSATEARDYPLAAGDIRPIDFESPSLSPVSGAGQFIYGAGCCCRLVTPLPMNVIPPSIGPMASARPRSSNIERR